MDFDPKKFSVSVIDVFSVLVPGAAITYLLQDRVSPWLVGNHYKDLHGTEAWLLFVFASYLVGHLLYHFGSLLDELLYLPLVKGIDPEQIRRLARGKNLSMRPFRWLASIIFKNSSRAAYDRAASIKERYLQRVGARNDVGVFQWSKTTLAINHPEALVIVNRYEADSKFFSSLIPAMLILAVIHYPTRMAVPIVVLMFLALWRYLTLRFKANQQAYWFVLILEAEREQRKEETQPQRSRTGRRSAPVARREPTHVGAVIFRKSNQGLEFLLVRPSIDVDDWHLPALRLEPGHDARFAAVEATRQQTGVWATFGRELDVIEDPMPHLRGTVRFVLLKKLEEGRKGAKNKDPRYAWFPWVEAAEKLSLLQRYDWRRHAEEGRLP